MTRARALALLAGVIAMSPAVAAQVAEDFVLTALRDELQRAMASLRIEGQPAPYYIAYQLDDLSGRRVTARLGETGDESFGRSRTLRVEVRVGDYDFDSSRFQSGLVTESAQIIDDDYDALRRHAWLLTDSAYKRAVNVFARKKAAFQNRNAEEAIPDFSKETPVQRVLESSAPTANWSDWSGRVRQMSAVFVADPLVLSSEVNLIEEHGRRHFISSEGFSIVSPIGLSAVRVVAETQAADGTTVRDAIELYEGSLSDMPPAPELLARTRDLAARLAAARQAPPGDEYTGPVLFEGGASAELVAQVLVPALLATRAVDSERAAPVAQPPFLARIGSKVLAEELTVTDTPSLARLGQRPVPGAYVLDDEGVAAQDVTLVEGGRLMTLLTSRVPQRGLPRSNGHGRGGGVQAGVVQVTSSAAVPMTELKARYLALLKEQGRAYGYIVRSVVPPTALAGTGTDVSDILSLLVSGGAPSAAPAGPLLPQIIKVTPEGTEAVVRSMRLGPVAPNLFRDVIGASQERTLHTWRGAPGSVAAVGSLGSRQVPVSAIVPALIIDDLEIQRVREVAQKLPVVASPLAR